MELAARLSAPLEQLVEKRTRWRLFKTRGVSNAVSGSRPLHLLSPQRSLSTYSVLSLVRFSICSAISLCVSLPFSLRRSLIKARVAYGGTRRRAKERSRRGKGRRRSLPGPPRDDDVLSSRCVRTTLARSVAVCAQPLCYPLLFSFCFSRLSTPSCAYISCLPQR